MTKDSGIMTDSPVAAPIGLRQSDSMSAEYGRPMILRSAKGEDILRLNRAFIVEFGLTTEDVSLKPLLDWIHPDDRMVFEEVLVVGQGDVSARHRTNEDDWLGLEWRIKTHDGQAVALGVPRQGTPPISKPNNDNLPPVNDTLSQTLEAMVHIVESKSNGLLCSIQLVDSECHCITACAGPSLPEEYNAAVRGLTIGPVVGSCGTAAFWNVPVVVEDITQDPLWKDLRETAAIAGVCACWSVPITRENGTVLGSMALYDFKPSVPAQHQIDMLEISARMVGLAIEGEHLEQQLRSAAKMEAVGVLAGGVAHDFNNLLAAIRGNAELAAATLPKDVPAAENFRRIVSATDTATELCNQMLTYAGRGTSSTELLDCNVLVRELGDLLKAAISKKTTLDYKIHDTPLGVVADQSQMRQVLMNLITNASEALGGEVGWLDVGTRVEAYTNEELVQRYPHTSLRAGEYVRIWVSDSGVGMTPEIQARIFDPFFTTKEDGRGLGLAAVQGIVRAHGGEISVESRPGLGSRIIVILPRVQLEPLQEPPVEGHRGGTKSAARILVGEDEDAVREVLVMALEQAGYEVIEAVDGQEVVDIFRLDPAAIDCVLLDLNMPRLDGEEAFAAMREIRPDVCVVLSSGFAEQELLNRFRGAGLAGVVHKPAKLQDLLDTIADALRTFSS